MMGRGTDPPPGPRARAARTILLVVPLLLLAAAAPLVHAQGSVAFPLVLDDPVAGAKVRIDSGARALHLVFFATWCPPCLDEFESLADLEARYRHRGYRLVLVAVPTRQSADRLAQMIQRRRPPGTVTFDASGNVHDALGIGEIPAHVVIDSKGQVVHRGDGLKDGVEQAITGLLRGGR
jgi:thiol-disulfide isomerase/thioredoxin